MIRSSVPDPTYTADAIKQRILGTWQLVSFIREEQPAGAQSDVMGAQPSGYINYGSDDRVIVVITASNRNKPVGAVPTPSEAAMLIKSMISYAGGYKIDTQAQTITHQIDVSWNESYTGRSQVRKYRFENDCLLLTTVPSPDPASGEPTIRTLTWVRLH